MSNITFVDEDDNVIGAGTKKEVWEKGIWHRVVRINLLNKEGKLLIAKRSETLSSAPGLWESAAAGHVDEGESYGEAAARELKEELGISAPLEEVGKAKSPDLEEPDKKKNRFHMVYVVRWDGEVNPDPGEISETRWVTPAELDQWITRSPDEFTAGLKLCFHILVEKAIVHP